ncbi:MAG: DUF4870 domain-containing protein [Pyrinomonadaceae bacterium]|nr:DUF4870 domain-containing protein [Pyrinomonadaceae bacterium]
MQNQKSALGLDGNVTALIGYPVGIVALILLFIEKDNKFVRFHAIQSLLFWAAFMVILIGLGIISGVLAFVSGTLATLVGLLSFLVWIALLGLLILLAIKAFQGQMFKLPIIGDMASKWA